MLKFWRKPDHAEASIPSDLPFFEVVVAPNESWTIRNSKSMPLVFPTHTFSRFARSVVGEKLYQRYAGAMFRGLLAGSSTRQADEEAVVETWGAVENYLQRWTTDQMDRAVLFPTFQYHGDDAVKALRAVVQVRAQLNLSRQNWKEVVVSPYATGTLISDEADVGEWPRTCIDHGKLRSVIGNARAANAFLWDGKYSIADASFSELLKTDIIPLSKPLPRTEFSLIIIFAMASNLGFRRDTNWRQLTDDYLPTQLQHTGLIPSRPIPDMGEASRRSFESRFEDLLDWAYDVGLLCRLFMWLDGAFRDPAATSSG